MLADSGARLFLVADEQTPQARSLAGDGCIPLSRWRAAQAAGSLSPLQLAAEDPAFWLYSSGTTGRPKGIVHTHKDVLPAGQAMREVLGLQAGDTVVCTSRLFFAYGLEHGLLGTLSIGATAVLLPDGADPGQIPGIVAKHRPKAAATATIV